jgi:hypothetical protein
VLAGVGVEKFIEAVDGEGSEPQVHPSAAAARSPVAAETSFGFVDIENRADARGLELAHEHRQCSL